MCMYLYSLAYAHDMGQGGAMGPFGFGPLRGPHIRRPSVAEGAFRDRAVRPAESSRQILDTKSPHHNDCILLMLQICFVQHPSGHTDHGLDDRTRWEDPSAGTGPHELSLTLTLTLIDIALLKKWVDIQSAFPQKQVS